MVYYSKLTGVSYENDNGEHRQLIIFQLKRRGLLEQGQELLFQHQPWNKFDSNAIAVFGADSRQLGFLHKDMASLVCKAMNQCQQVKLYVESVTGGESGQLLGVNVKIIISQNANEITDLVTEIKDLINKIKTEINFTNSNCSNDSFDDDMAYYLEQEKYNWNPHDLDEQEYENWLDDLMD